MIDLNLWAIPIQLLIYHNIRKLIGHTAIGGVIGHPVVGDVARIVILIRKEVRIMVLNILLEVVGVKYIVPQCVESIAQNCSCQLRVKHILASSNYFTFYSIL